MPTDERIIELVNANRLSGWQYLYDKYAGMMYGILVTRCENAAVADEVLSRIFKQLQDKFTRISTPERLPVLLIGMALEMSGKENETAETDRMLMTPNPVLCSLLYTNNSLLSIASQTGLSYAAVKKRLHVELKELRIQQELLKSHPEQWYISRPSPHS